MTVKHRYFFQRMLRGFVEVINANMNIHVQFYIGLSKAELGTRIDADHALCQPNKLQNIFSAI